MKATTKELTRRIRNRLLSGAYVGFDSLTPEEFGAAQDLLLTGEVEIMHSNCRPHFVAKLNRTIIDS